VKEFCADEAACSIIVKADEHVLVLVRDES
jgi:hypothetical protein